MKDCNSRPKRAGVESFRRLISGETECILKGEDEVRIVKAQKICRYGHVLRGTEESVLVSIASWRPCG